MIDESNVDRQVSEKPAWVWWSTHETVEQEIPSATAIFETFVAVSLYWWLAIHFNTYGFLVIGACAAPLVLMRSNKSIALGVKWFGRWEEQFKIDNGLNFSRYDQTVITALWLISLMGIIAASYILASAFLVGAKGLTAFLGGFGAVMAAGLTMTAITLALVIAAVPWVSRGISRSDVIVEVMLTMVGTGAVAAAATILLVAQWSAAIGSLAAAGLFVLLAGLTVVSTKKDGPPIGGAIKASVLVLFGLFPMGVGVGLGVFIAALFIRIAATLRHFLSGFFSIPINFRRLVVRMSPIHEPELIPGLPAASTFALPRLKNEFMRIRRSDEGSFEFALIGVAISMVILFSPAWLYRFTLKSTAWVWWPLAFIIDSPKLARTPEWQYKAMVGTLVGWISISAASYTDMVFLFKNYAARIWREGLPENPLLTPLGYFFMLDWSGSFWPIFSIVGPTISIVTLLWLNRTFSKYKTATKHQYEGLQREAERTFSAIERIQRVQFVLFVVYCSLVVTQAALYVNAQRCWVSIAPNAQSWSDMLFGDKSPHQPCDAREPHKAAPT